MHRIDVRVPLPVVVTPSADPADWLPRPHRHAGPDRWVVNLPRGPWRHPVAVTLGAPWRTGPELGRAIAWEVEPTEADALPFDRLLPPAHGTVVATPGELELRVDYAPPAGWLGRLLDPVLRHLARRGVRDVAEAIAAAVAATGTPVHPTHLQEA